MPCGLACEAIQGLRHLGERGGGPSLGFSQALVSLISLVPGPAKTVWTGNQGVLQVSIQNLNIYGHISPPDLFAGTDLSSADRLARNENYLRHLRADTASQTY